MAADRVTPGDGDAHRRYSPDEVIALTSNLEKVIIEIHSGDWSSERCDESLLRSLHARIFDGVRDFAGRFRSRDWGTNHVSFGPNRSVSRLEVQAELARIFAESRRSLSSLDSARDDPDYERAVFHISTWVHAEVVRVHPFEDGNGRASRLLMNWCLVRCGLRTIAVEVIKHEYNDCLNRYLRSRDIQPLIDLLLRPNSR